MTPMMPEQEGLPVGPGARRRRRRRRSGCWLAPTTLPSGSPVLVDVLGAHELARRWPPAPSRWRSRRWRPCPAPGGRPVSFTPTMRVPAMAAKSAAFCAARRCAKAYPPSTTTAAPRTSAAEGDGEERDGLAALRRSDRAATCVTPSGRPSWPSRERPIAPEERADDRSHGLVGVLDADRDEVARGADGRRRRRPGSRCRHRPARRSRRRRGPGPSHRCRHCS